MTTTAVEGGPPDRALVLTRVFDAPAALLFEVWTDPRHLMAWWGPRRHPVAQMEMDVRPGGAWRGCLRSSENGEELWQRGTFREVAPPHRIVFTFVWEEAGERGLETLVTVTFADEGGKTRMTLRQTPFQSVAERDGHGGGWSSSFDRLEDHLAQYRKA
jgi:uncharacterized protein YndB with AHSA1/START domain